MTTDQFNGSSAIDLSSLSGSTISPWTVTASGAGTGSTFAWQSPNTVWTTATLPLDKLGTIELRGEDADIVVNGKSMMKLLERIEERLNLLEPNTELEKDWDDLRKLGERYRRLEKKCKEKAETWKKLKAMPVPNVD